MLIVLALAKPSVKYEELANIVAVLDARRSRHQTDRRLPETFSEREGSAALAPSFCFAQKQKWKCIFKIFLRPVEKISSA